jgi:type IV secretion system protein VirD4
MGEVDFLREKQVLVLIVLTALFAVFMVIVHMLDGCSLNSIRAKQVGNGQHGTARWATKREIRSAFFSLPFEPEKWRNGEHLPQIQGTVVGCRGRRHTTALVDTGMYTP